MVFGWADYVALARELGARADDEAAQRSAISRAYYAAFGLAQERLIEWGWQAAGGRPHHGVWSTYQSSPREACRRIGEIGFVLRDQRNTADYRRPLPPWFVARDETTKALQRASRLVGLLARLGSDESCF